MDVAAAAAMEPEASIRYPLLVVLVSLGVVLVSLVWYALRRRGGDSD